MEDVCRCYGLQHHCLVPAEHVASRTQHRACRWQNPHLWKIGPGLEGFKLSAEARGISAASPEDIRRDPLPGGYMCGLAR